MYFKHTICEDIVRPNILLEPFILKNVKSAYFYSKNILKKRWKECEKVLLNITYYGDLEYVYLYSKNVIKKRWRDGENKMLSTQFHSNNQIEIACQKFLIPYARNVIKGRWKEIESYVLKTNQIGNYLSILNEEDAKEFNRIVILNSLKRESVCGKFVSWKPTHKIKIDGKKSFDALMVESNKKFEIRCWPFTKKPNCYFTPTPNPDYVINSSNNSYLVYTLEEWISYGDNDHRYVTNFIYNHQNNTLFKGPRGKRKVKVEAEITKIE